MTGRATHNQSRPPTRAYQAWANMLQRCTNPKHDKFAHYGGRGIMVCDQWRLFEGFFSDMGACPPKLTLERIDNALGYSPDNCRWASVTDQHKNMRSNRLITIGDKTLCVSEWAEIYPTSKEMIHRRIALGWDLVQAVTAPRQRRSKSYCTR